MSKNSKHINFHSSSAVAKCSRVLANLLKLTFAARRLPGSRGNVFVSGDSDAGENDWLKVNACCVGPFLVSYSMRSPPSAILGRTPAGSQQIAIVAKLTAQTPPDGPEMGHRARYDLCVGIRNAVVPDWSANKKLWDCVRKITSG
jgi:hypothetical protein